MNRNASPMMKVRVYVVTSSITFTNAPEIICFTNTHFPLTSYADSWQWVRSTPLYATKNGAVTCLAVKKIIWFPMVVEIVSESRAVVKAFDDRLTMDENVLTRVWNSVQV